DAREEREVRGDREVDERELAVDEVLLALERVVEDAEDLAHLLLRGLGGLLVALLGGEAVGDVAQDAPRAIQHRHAAPDHPLERLGAREAHRREQALLDAVALAEVDEDRERLEDREAVVDDERYLAVGVEREVLGLPLLAGAEIDLDLLVRDP